MVKHVFFLSSLPIDIPFNRWKRILCIFWYSFIYQMQMHVTKFCSCLKPCTPDIMSQLLITIMVLIYIYQYHHSTLIYSNENKQWCGILFWTFYIMKKCLDHYFCSSRSNMYRASPPLWDLFMRSRRVIRSPSSLITSTCPSMMVSS